MIQEHLFNVLISPMYTEKATANTELSKYTFKINNKATKLQVKKAIEKLFGAKVLKVNILNCKAKAKVFKGIKGSRNKFKKAIVTFEKGKTIDFGVGAK
jgi:large subunit ribosomal protein L23